MFILNMVNDQHQQVPLYFNPYTMKFSTDPDQIDDTGPSTVVAEKIHTNRPKVLKVLLGDACNYRCQYCRQDHHGAKELFNKRKMEHFTNMLSDNLDLSNLERIEYWGGEPLLYWDEIEHVIEWSKALKQPIYQHITTNGSLFNEQIVNTIKSHDFLLKLSHDGPGQHLRSGDPLISKEQEILDIYTHMKDQERSTFFINSVLTKLHPSPLQIVNWFRTRFGLDVLIMKMEPVIPYNDEARKFAIPESDLKMFSSQITQDIIRGDIVKNVVEYQMLWNSFLFMTNEQYVYNSTEAKCHIAQLETICTDMNGNITPCQVYDQSTPDQIIGNLKDMNNINDVLPFAPISRGDRCKRCPVISFCRGVCPYISEGEAADINCNVRYHTYFGILAAYLLFETGLYLNINNPRAVDVYNPL